MSDTTCEYCDEPARYGRLCDAHRKRQQRGEDMTAPIQKKPQSSLERLCEAAITYADADEDGEFERARDNLRKSAMAYGNRGHREAILAGLADARARGVRLGRPSKLDPAEVEAHIAAAGGVKRAAVALGVSVRTVRNARRQARMMREAA